MSAQARCCTHMGTDRGGTWARQGASSALQEPKRCLGSTDLLMCIGEMCATLQVLARERHGHGRGPWNARYDRKLTAQLHRLASQNKILQRGLG